MTLRVAGRADAEAAEGADVRDELVRVAVLIRQGKAASLGMSPRRASTFSMPRSRSWVRTWRTPSFVEETHVRCARAGTPQRSTSLATSAVKAEVPPPAPYVTEMNVGRRAATLRAISLYSESSLPSLGGNSSQESVTSRSFRHWRINMCAFHPFAKTFSLIIHRAGRRCKRPLGIFCMGREPGLSLSNAVDFAWILLKIRQNRLKSHRK